MKESFFVLVYDDGDCVKTHIGNLITFADPELAKKKAIELLKCGASSTKIYLALVVGHIINPEPEYVPLLSRREENE